MKSPTVTQLTEGGDGEKIGEEGVGVPMVRRSINIGEEEGVVGGGGGEGGGKRVVSLGRGGRSDHDKVPGGDEASPGASCRGEGEAGKVEGKTDLHLRLSKSASFDSWI